MLTLIIKQFYVLYKTALLIPHMWVNISEPYMPMLKLLQWTVSSSVLGEFDYVQ